jgi:hypothetical protein
VSVVGLMIRRRVANIVERLARDRDQMRLANLERVRIGVERSKFVVKEERELIELSKKM